MSHSVCYTEYDSHKRRYSKYPDFTLSYYLRQVLRSVVFVGWSVGWFVRSFIGVLISVFVNMCWGRISRERLEIEALFQWTTNRKRHMANQMVARSMTSRDS